MLGVSAAVVVSVTALGIALFSGGARPAAADPSGTHSIVAVVPFAATGDLPVSFPKGIAELVAAALHGLGGTEVIPVSSIMAADPAEAVPDLERRRIASARRLGAGTVIVGNAVLARDRLRLSAVVEHASGSPVPPDRVVVEGAMEELLSLADQLAREIAATRFRAPADRLKRSAALSTSSVAALRSFLEGENHLRAESFGEAIDAFGSATIHDAHLGLAYYRLGIAADLAGRDSLARWALQAAISPTMRLSARDRRLVEAYSVDRGGGARRAELLYGEFVEDYPDDVEGWLNLGQLQFAHAPAIGRSVLVSRHSFERVAALDPHNSIALIHLARIAALEGKQAVADSLMGAVLGADARSLLGVRPVRNFVLNDGSMRNRASKALLATQHADDARHLQHLVTRPHDLEGIERFARRLSGSEVPEARALGFRLLGKAAAARGRWDEAVSAFARSQEDAPVLALEQLALLAALPFMAPTEESLRRLHASVEAWDPGLAEIEPVHSGAHRGLHGAIRLHRLGMLELRLGDTAAASARVSELRRMRPADERAGRLTATLEHSLHARLEAVRGHREAALFHLDSAAWLDAGNVFESEAADRYLRAELYEAIGRRDDALRWFASMSQRTAYEIVYLAPAALRAARLHSQERNDAAARRSAQIFLSAWTEPDPQLRPLVDEARQLARR
jgi:tetratricopeptide (TPR) repeat protein